MGSSPQDGTAKQADAAERSLAPSYILYFALLSALVGAQALRLAFVHPHSAPQRTLLAIAVGCVALVGALHVLWRVRRAKAVSFVPLALAIVPAVAIAALLATLPDRLIQREMARMLDAVQSVSGDQVKAVRVYRPGQSRELLTVADKAALQTLAAACKQLKRYEGALDPRQAPAWKVVIDGPRPIEIRCYTPQPARESLVLEVVKEQADRTLVCGRYVGMEMRDWLEENVSAPLAATGAAAMPGLQ